MTVMTETRAGTDDRRTDDRATSAADAFAPMKIQTPRSSSWTREEGIRYLVALDVDGTLVDTTELIHQSMRQVDMQFIVNEHDYEQAIRSLHQGLVEPYDHGRAIRLAAS